MMNNPWTQGPWKVIPSRYTYASPNDMEIVSGEREVPGIIPHIGRLDEEDEAKANIALIAAAPELAEALREVLAYEPLPHIWREVGLAAEPIAEKYTRARALLARIRGE